MFIKSYQVPFNFPNRAGVLKVILLFLERRKCHGSGGIQASQDVLKHQETFRTKSLTQVICFSIFLLP